MSSFDDHLRLFDYALPPAQIAVSPASPRDSARLLVYRRSTGDIRQSTFRLLGDFLPEGALLVLNRTKVIPARLPLTRSTGGVVQALYLGNKGEEIRVLANRRLKLGEILTVETGKDVSKKTLVGVRHALPLPTTHHFVVAGDEGKEWILQPSFPLSVLPRVLMKYGQTPLPPYIKNSPLTERERRREYQTVFAKEPGSIAAPTASLHFSTRLLKDLHARGIETAHVTLHVHLGTFAPLTEDQWKNGSLHREEFSVPAATAKAIERAKKEGRPVIAVGTTCVRTLESAADASGALTRLSGETDLFIRDGYKWKVIDGMITNFHVPKSSLMMLVAAFTGREELMKMYRYAIDEKFRFFSFGDGMLIL